MVFLISLFWHVKPSNDCLLALSVYIQSWLLIYNDMNLAIDAMPLLEGQGQLL